METDIVSLFIENAASAGLAIPDMGYEDFRTRKSLDRFRIQGLYIMHFVVAGKGVYMTGGKRYDVKGGEAFMCFPGEPICYFADTLDPYRYFWISFSGSEASGMCQRLGFSLHDAVKTVGEAAKIHELFEATLPPKSMPGEFEAKALFYNIASKMDGRENGRPAKRLSQKLHYYNAIKDYIELNFMQPELRIEHIAEYLHISHVYLCKIFKETTGFSAVSYLKEYRLNKAFDMLKTGEHTVTEVYLLCGYNDPSHFSREFRTKFGFSPSTLIKA